MSFVLDASVSLTWFFEDEFSDYTRRVRAALMAERAMAPWIWCVEVANGLVVAERRGRIEAAKVDRASTLLAALPVDVDTSAPNPSRLLEICRRHQRTAYDAVYLDLARREGYPLATVDAGLIQACKEAGVQVFDA